MPPDRETPRSAIKRMGLTTVEGEKDDICSIGQTLAAQDLCSGVRAYRRVHPAFPRYDLPEALGGEKFGRLILPDDG
jgi:poly-beta-hydroxyalkanoate depolymerase